MRAHFARIVSSSLAALAAASAAPAVTVEWADANAPVEQIQLFMFGFHYLFLASGSRNPAELALQLSGSIDLPLLGDVPALTSRLPAEGAAQ